ncbi:MAG: DNA repair protein RecN, partial [Gammaproteobacteria bacterium]|nr:DNA repair protein RecN [Gammaproteobacteria bacterium]
RGMEGGRFKTSVVLQAQRPGRHGSDEIEFLVSANPGQEPRPLSKVASGGELSRIGLAIEMLTAQHQPVATMVFDEVDAGVGGGIAEIIGQKLRSLGESIQVLCVTHLPQVASQAHDHVLVTKLTDGNTTHTQLVALAADRRVEEIARMLGGVEITDATRRHAREMLALLPAVGTDSVDV